MTLATRCSSCGTVFRVVQDQLRVSQGWVRCGRCGEAFNAQESMVDVPTALAPEPKHGHASEPFAPTDFGPTAVMDWADGSAATVPGAPPVSASTAASTQGVIANRGQTPPVQNDNEDDSAYVLDDPPVTTPPGSGHLLDLPLGVTLIASDGAVAPAAADPAPGRAEPTFDVDDSENGDFPGPVDVLDPDPAAAGTGASSEPFLVLAQASPSPPSSMSAATLTSADPSTASPSPPEAPSFLVQAERDARWRRPGVRLGLVAVTLLSATGLAAQVAFVYRDRIAANLPTWRPALQRACAVLDCRVDEFRQIESLSVESSGLVPVEGTSVYRLAVTLRNRASVEVAAPALDLAVTDAQGRPIARRVLQMSDLYLPLRSLKPGSELPIQVPLGIADRAIAGYTVEIFYP